MIDVGGEGNALISEIFKVVAHARGTFFDRAHMIAAARTYMQKNSEPQRVEIIAGDPFKPLFQRDNVYLFPHVLAKLSANKSLKLLKNCQIALNNKSLRLCLRGLALYAPQALHVHIVFTTRSLYSELARKNVACRNTYASLRASAFQKCLKLCNVTLANQLHLQGPVDQPTYIYIRICCF